MSDEEGMRLVESGVIWSDTSFFRPTLGHTDILPFSQLTFFRKNKLMTFCLRFSEKIIGINLILKSIIVHSSIIRKTPAIIVYE